MVSFVLAVVFGSILAALAAYGLVRWLFRKDTEIENRRRASSKLAGKLRALGLVRIPDFLEDHSVGDYSGMGQHIYETAKLFLDGEAAVLAEFAKVFDNLLTAKLSTEAGRAFIAAKLSDAAMTSDVSIVADAPAPTTK